VRRDSTFLLHNRLYEAPPHLANRTFEVRFDPLDAAQAEIWFQGRQEAMARPVDPVVNGPAAFGETGGSRTARTHRYQLCRDARAEGRYLTLLLVGQPPLRHTLSLQMHEPLRQRIAVQYHGCAT
jgi:hypothetical protein